MSGDWLNMALKLGVVAVIVGAAYALMRRRYSFELRIDADEIRVTRGIVPSMLREETLAVFQAAGIADGWIGGRRRGRMTLLDFSRNVPHDVRQRIRNLVNFVK